MAAADTARLIAALELDPRKFVKGLSTADKAFGKFESRGFRAGQQIGLGIKNSAKLVAVGIGALATQIGFGVDQLFKLEDAQKQTEAVIKSTGGAAAVSAGGVRRLAEEFESLNALMDDKVIQSGENMLLTFTNIRGKAFKPALEAVLDLNTAMGNGPEGLTRTAIQVGKALNDPSVGLTALRKVGVSFSKEQIKRIKSLQKEGKLYEAQKIILGELSKEFGGSFRKQGETGRAAVAKFGDAVEDAQAALAEGFLPVIRNVADSLSDLLADPATKTAIRDFGTSLAGIFTKEKIGAAFRTLGDIIGTIKDAMPAIVDAAKTIGGVVSAAVDIFNKLPAPLKAAVIGGFAVNKLTGGLITNIGGGILDKLFQRGGSPANPMWVQMAGAGGLPGAGVASGAGKGIGTLGKLFLVGEAIGLIAAVNDLRQQISDSSTQQAQEVGTKLQEFIAQSPSASDLQSALDGVNQGINDLQANPLLVLVQGDALDQLRAMKASLAAQLARTKGSPLLEQRHGEQGGTAAPVTPKAPAHDLMGGKSLADVALAVDRKGEQTTGAVNTMKTTLATAVGDGSLHIGQAVATNATNVGTAVATAGTGVQGSVSTAGSGIQGAVRGGAATVAGAVRASRPIITVGVHVQATQVTKSVTIQERYGDGGGSSNSSGH